MGSRAQSERPADGMMPAPRRVPSHMYQMWGSGGFYEPLRENRKGPYPVAECTRPP